MCIIGMNENNSLKTTVYLYSIGITKRDNIMKNLVNLTKHEIETILDSLQSEMLELENYNKKYKNHPNLNKFLTQISSLRKIRIKLNLMLEDL